MKKLTTILLLLVAASSAQAERLMTGFTWDPPIRVRPRGAEPVELDPDGWVPFSYPDSVPLRLTHATAYDPIHDRVYMISGTSAGNPVSGLRFCQCYDPRQDTWELLAYMPEGRCWIGAALVRGRIYVPCGYTNYNTASRSLFMYDIAADSWAILPLCPRATCAYQIVVWRDSLIYMIGGVNPQLSASVADVDVYDPATGVWRSATPLPRGIDMGSAAVIGDTIYITNGYHRPNADVVDSLYRGSINPSDPLQIAWEVGPELPCPFPDRPRGLLLAGTAALDGRLHWAGGTGYWGHQRHNQAWVYDPATGLIDTIHSLPGRSFYIPHMLVSRPRSGELYIVSGQIDWDTTVYYRLRVAPAPDVGPVEIVVPSGGHAVGDTVLPRVVFRNFGSVVAGFDVWLMLFDPDSLQAYGELLHIDALSPRTDTLMEFPRYVLPRPGGWRVCCGTLLPGDPRPENDTMSGRFTVGTVGIGDAAKAGVLERRLPTLVRGELRLPAGADAVLLDACGRRVMELPGSSASGALRHHDVRHLTPGVYFLVDEGRAPGFDVRKVIVTR